MEKCHKVILNVCVYISIFIFLVSIIKYNNLDFSKGSIFTNASTNLSNKKICWGLKRANNHEQPDVGKENKNLLDKYNGICLGNSESKKVYLTFDCGYEAGYMEKILEVLKQNDVKACFFITAHYLNSQPELVQKMIDDGHIVRKPYCKT